MGPRFTPTSAPPAPRSPSEPASSRPSRLGGGSALWRSMPEKPVMSEVTARKVPSDHDMRRKRPPALSFLLRMATARRVARIVSLLALDFVGVSLAIFTALILKEDLHAGHVAPADAVHGTKQFLAFAYLLTALLFARSGLYADRAQRPGLSRIVGSLFQVAFVALLFAVISGEHFQSYYLFYGSLAFALLYVSLLREGYERATGLMLRAAGYRRRAVLVGTGKHIRDVAHALGNSQRSPIEVVGFLSPTALPANGLRSLGSLQDLEKLLGSERIDEVIIA